MRGIGVLLSIEIVVRKTIARQSLDRLPALLPSKALVEECENLGHIELDIFKVKVLLVVLLHL